MAIEDLRRLDWVLLPGTLCTCKIFHDFLDLLQIPKSQRKPVELRHPRVEDHWPEVAGLARGAVVCGFSLGAIVAAHLADRLAAKRIILFGINPLADDPAKADGRLALARDVASLGGAKALASRLPELRGPDPDRARDRILAMADRAAPLVDAQTQLALTRPGALDALSRARSPVIVLTGGEDGMAPVELGRSAAQAAPLGRFRLLDGLGHYSLVEDPQACAEAILELESTLS